MMEAAEAGTDTVVATFLFYHHTVHIKLKMVKPESWRSAVQAGKSGSVTVMTAKLANKGIESHLHAEFGMA